MARLKSRQMQIPNGMRFLQPETGWKSTRFASFDSIVTSLIAHRVGGPIWWRSISGPPTTTALRVEVEQFNVDLCLRAWLELVCG